VGIPTGPVCSDCTDSPGSCRSFESSEALGTAPVKAEVCIERVESVYWDLFVVWELMKGVIFLLRYQLRLSNSWPEPCREAGALSLVGIVASRLHSYVT
jgi:hypothetical protein